FNARGFAERTAVNTPLQGTAADLIKLAMIRIDDQIRQRGLLSRMTLQVYDELVFEVPEAEVDILCSLVREQTEAVYRLRELMIAAVDKQGTQYAHLPDVSLTVEQAGAERWKYRAEYGISTRDFLLDWLVLF